MSSPAPIRTDPVAITCAFCGKEFAEDRSQPACQACPLAQGCHFIRCPHCGYESPLRPGWLGRLSDWMSRDVSD